MAEALEPTWGFHAALLAGVSDGFLLTDADGVVRWASAGASRLLERDLDDIVGRNTIELQHPDDAELSALRRSEEDDRVRPLWSSVRRVVLRDGTHRTLDCTSVDLRHVPEVGGIAVVLRDALERHQAWETERRLRALVEKAQDALLVYGPDLRVSYASPAAHILLDDLSGTLLDHVHRFVDASQLDDILEAYAKVLSQPGGYAVRLLRLNRTDGVGHWVEVQATNLLDDPAVRGLVLNGRDVTRQVELQERVTANERRFRAMVEHADELIMVITPEGAVDYQSPASRRLLGPFDQLADAIDSLIPAEHHERAAEAFAELVAADGRVVEWTVPMVVTSGETRVMHLYGTNLLHDPDVGGLVINGNDVTARTALEDGLRRAATTDPLTGLPNRTQVVELLRSSLAAQDHRGVVAVLFLDLDRFKVVNDSFGHATGDRVLVELGQRLRTAIPDGTVGRFGGDEYVVVVPVPDADAAVARADALARAALDPFVVGGPGNERVEVYLSGSIGIALGSSASSPEQLLHHADAAMYRAKERGRGTWELYDDGMRAAALSRLTLEAELARALDDRGFELHYQPIVEVGTGRVRGLEALARWRHRERGFVSPSEFIPVAEETGGIHRLGAWALATATSQLRAWRSTPAADLTISVNLSPRQLTRDELAGDVAELLERSGIPPGQVTLEITETLLMDDLELAVKALARLRDTGVRLALDDFGTGWSSLTYLRSVPVDVVKIDRSFIHGVAESADDRAIVGAVIAMCRALGKEVVAEGVETEAQFRALRELGCTHAQGYLFAKPLAAPEVRGWLERYGPAGHRDPDGTPT